MFKKRRENFNIIILALVGLILTFMIAHSVISKKIEMFVYEYCVNEIEYLVISTMNQITLTDMEDNPEDYKYICEILQNDSNEIIAVTTDTYKINKIKNRLNIASDDILENNELKTIYVPIGSLSDDFLLFNQGIDIPVKMEPMTTTKVDFASSFTSAGINQTLHQIIVECTVYVTILMPFTRADFETTHKIAISETILLGSVPESYTHININ